MKNICIYGAGGVGGYFGAKMIRNNRDHLVHVSFIARGRHLDQIQERGLTLIGDNETIAVRPDAASREIAQVPF
jgi:2-dehydropantoate 2-reductase